MAAFSLSIALLALAATRSVVAYPELIEEYPSCSAHPERNDVFPHHWFVVPDPTGTAWTAYLDGELLDGRLCPGHTHSVLVSSHLHYDGAACAPNAHLGLTRPKTAPHRHSHT